LLYCTVTPLGISIEWLTGVPADSVPPKETRGWRRVAARVPPAAPWGPGPDEPYINVPDATLHIRRIAGVELSWGKGQILRPLWFIYRASSLLPLRGILIEWPVLFLYS